MSAVYPPENKTVTQFLWKAAHLKSRASFLMVFEFLNIRRDQIKSVLKLVKSQGDAFSESFVESSAQFHLHDVRASEDF